MLVAVAAMGFACQENVADFTPERANEVVMTITADVDETRTYIDEENKIVKWSEGDQLKVIENSAVYRTSEAATIDADGKAQFAVSFPKNDGAVTYNAVFPASAVVEEAEVNANEVQVAVKSFQYPTATSFDPQADVLVAKELEFDAQPESLNMQFKRIVSLGKMTLNKIEDDAKISKVIFTVENQGLAGRNTVNTTTGEVVSYGDVNTITLTYTEPIATRDIYFTCNPFKLVANDTFKVTVICADNTAYVREVTLAGDKELTITEGDMSTFSVTMEKVNIKTESSWNLVKDVNNLAVGDQIIIAARDSNVAMSITQNNNNRGQVAITKSGNTISTPGTTVQKLTLQAGTKSDTFAFYTGSGYLYAASSGSNYLKTQTTNNDNGSWSIKVNTTDGTAEIIAQGTNTRNVMQYNQTSSLFACYGDASQKAIVIYKYTETVSGGDIEILPEPSFSVDVESIKFAAEGGEEIITVTPENNFYGAVTATTDAEWLTIENDDYTFTITAGANEGNGRSAVVTFSAQDCDDVEVTVSQAANTNSAINATVAEFLDAKEDETLYRLRGTIMRMYGTESSALMYGNFYLKDNTGEVLIYGLCSPAGEEQYWAASGAQIGDDIEILTVRASYNNSPQGKNAIFVEKQRPGTIAFWSFDKTSASFSSEGGVAEIKVAAYNLKEDIALEFKAGENGNLFEADYDNGVLTISAKENSSTDELNATLYVRSGDLEQVITISQAAYVEPGEGGTKEESVDFTAQGYTNQQAISEYKGKDFLVKFDKGTNSNAPKYYTNGAAIRCYGSNSFTVSSDYVITKIELTYGSSDGSNTISTDCESFSEKTWTGRSNSVKFTIGGTTGNRRIQGIKVTYLK